MTRPPQPSKRSSPEGRASRTPQARPPITTDIPARLDRLRWGRFHTLVVIALGVTWILDGLEVTLAGAVGGALFGAGLMIAAALIAARYCVPAERKPLEAVAKPLSAAD